MAAVLAARWTARLMAPFVLVAFVALGRRFGAAVTLRRTACRAAAFLHGVHLAAVAVVVALEPPAAAFTYLFLARLGDTAPRIAGPTRAVRSRAADTDRRAGRPRVGGHCFAARSITAFARCRGRSGVLQRELTADR